jgi:TolA-binding protein
MINFYLIVWFVAAAVSTADAQLSHPNTSPERLFAEGKDFFLIKNYAGAADKLEAYIQTGVCDLDFLQEAKYMLAYIEFDEGKEFALERLVEFLDNYPASRHCDEARLLIGKGFFEQSDYQAAETWLAQVRTDAVSGEQTDELYYRLGYAQLKNGNLKAAEAAFGKVGRFSADYTQAAIYYLAYIDYASGNYDEALKQFNRLKRTPEYREKSDYYIAQISFIKEKYDEVAKLTDRLLRNYPNSENNNELYRIAGNSYYRLGNQDKTVEMLKKYISGADKPGRDELYILGVSAYNIGDYNDAIDALAKTVTQDDAMAQNASMFLGQSYIRTGDKNKARMAFETASALPFDKKMQETALYNYALLVHETSFTGFGESVKVFEQFLNDYPNSQYADQVNDYLAEVYLTSKNYEAALVSINKIRKPSTKILEAKQNVLFQLGNQAFTNNRMTEAIDYFSRTLEMGSYAPEAGAYSYFWRGESYYRLEDYNHAIADFNSFKNQTRQSAGDAASLVYYNLGYCYFKRHDFQQSLVSFRRYVSLENKESLKSLADAYVRIGDCLFYDRKFAEAETNYTRAAELQPASADHAIYQKGFVLGLLKDYDGKIRQMDRIVNEFPQSQYYDDALYERGRTFVMIDKPQEAAQSFKLLMSRFPSSTLSPKAGLQLGMLYYNDNQLQNAVEAYKKVISDYPGSEEAKVAVQDLKSVYIDLNDVSAYAQYVNSLGGAMHIKVSEQDSLTFIAAEKLFNRGDFDGAQRSLVSYLDMFKSGAFSSNANYYLAKIAFDRKNYRDAKRLFTAVLDSGDPKFREEALARKSEIEYMDRDYAAAIKTFRELKTVAETRENRLAALLGLMRCAQFTGNEDEALDAANALLKEPNLSPEVEAEARYLRAKAYLKLGDSDKAIADLTALSKDTRTEYGAEAKYRLAQYYFDKKDVARAEKEMLNFVENGTTHQYWLARGFILLADIYINKGDDFQARQYLTSLKRNYGGKSEDIDRMIEQRLEKIKNN